MWQGYNLLGIIGAFATPRFAVGAWREVVTFYPAKTALIASPGDLVSFLPGPHRCMKSRGDFRKSVHLGHNVSTFVVVLFIGIVKVNLAMVQC
jgi:hypothetical protein